MDYQKAVTEAQTRADNTGIPVIVARDYQSPGGYRASYACDLRQDHTPVLECKPSGRFYGRWYHTPSGSRIRFAK